LYYIYDFITGFFDNIENTYSRLADKKNTKRPDYYHTNISSAHNPFPSL